MKRKPKNTIEILDQLESIVMASLTTLEGIETRLDDIELRLYYLDTYLDIIE